MTIRKVNTGTMLTKNWIDAANLINWIVSMVMFLFPAIMFPFYWFSDPLADFINAWFIVNVLADFIPIYYIAMFVMNLIIAIGSGSGTSSGAQYICDEVNTSDCVYDNAYIDVADAWGNFVAWFIIQGGLYFVLFWFGADAVRVLRPQGGYDLYYLFPNSLYDLLVVTNAAPKHSNTLDYDSLQSEIAA